MTVDIPPSGVLTREDYLWFGAAIVATALDYVLVAFLGLTQSPTKLQLMAVAPGVLAALLSVLAPASRTAGLATLFLVCVLFLEGPLTAALFGGLRGAGGWAFTIALFGAPLAAMLIALRRRPPPSVVGVQSIGAFARALAYYAGAQLVISIALFALMFLATPRIG